MGSVPFALSIHQFVSSAGSDAGFAALVGLALLVMLHFAQARETANLREQAYESAQRVGQLEARLAQLTRQPAAPPVAGAPASVRAAGNAMPASEGALGVAAPAHAPASVSAPVAIGPPAGVAAPALAAATRLIPVAIQNGPQRAGAVADRPAQAMAGSRSPAVASAAGAPAAATFAGTANGSGHDRGSPPPARGGGVAVQEPPRAAGPGPAPVGSTVHAGSGSVHKLPRPGVRPTAKSGARRPLLPPEPPPRRSRGLRVLAGLLVVAVLGGVVAVLLIATSGNGNSPPSGASSTSNAASSRAARAPAFKPSSVTVAVLNGTATTGLAHRTSVRLAAAGYKDGSVATATDQTRTATVVAYLPGHRSDAMRVAGTLRLRPASVQPIDPGTRAVACPPPSACTASVVVTVGSDLASR